ncbi:AAA family ATPase [Persicobacter diffluens]
MKKFPIGISDFKELINSESYYVDKTLLLEEFLVVNTNNVFLVPRPRRFGKTLNMSMIHCFLDVDHAEENRPLFETLKVQNSTAWPLQGKFPVIFLSFKDWKQSTFEKSINSLRLLLQDFLVEKMPYLLTSDKVLKLHRDYFNSIVEGEIKEEALELCLQRLIIALKAYHGVKPVVLIDEYDSPILYAHEYGYREEMVNFLRGFFSKGLKDNSEYHKAMVTGILRVAKENIFSGLNNMVVSTVVDLDFSDKFGLTESEVDQLLSDFKLSEQKKEIDRWYNGYTFGLTKKIYNPWSIINYLSYPDRGLRSFWANTSKHQLLQELLPRVDRKTSQMLVALMNRQSIESLISADTIFESLERAETQTVLGLLLFSGYLTVEEMPMKDGVSELSRIPARLRVPNEEVFTVYEKLLQQFLNSAEEYVQGSDLLEALLNQDFDSFSDCLKDYLLNSFSYFDVTNQRQSEKIYHAFILGLMAHLTDKYVVKSNPESGYGRADMIIYPKDPDDKKGWIFEFKRGVTGKESLQERAEEALQQIENSQYAAMLQQQGRSKVMKLGIAFDGKKVVCLEG